MTDEWAVSLCRDGKKPTLPLLRVTDFDMDYQTAAYTP